MGSYRTRHRREARKRARQRRDGALRRDPLFAEPMRECNLVLKMIYEEAIADCFKESVISARLLKN